MTERKRTAAGLIWTAQLWDFVGCGKARTRHKAEGGRQKQVQVRCSCALSPYYFQVARVAGRCRVGVRASKEGRSRGGRQGVWDRGYA